MLYSLVSDDAFLELFILLEKAGAALDCITEDINSSRDKTLSCIANDYIAAMGEQAKAMQENIVKDPT
jgi:hypothetical protein